MSSKFYIIPPHTPRAWWLADDDGNLICSACYSSFSGTELRDKTSCPNFHANMTVDERWVKEPLNRGYQNTKG